MANQELRQGINAINLSGEVKEHKLRLNKSKDGNYINGSLVIKTGEFSEMELGIYCKELNKDGKTKKTFETLNKFIDEDLKTLANLKGEDTATRVRVFGNKGFEPHFKEDMYKPEGSKEVITRIKTDLGFGNIMIDNSIKPEDFKANFEVEVFVQSVIPEIKEDEETGRAIIKGVLPAYGGKIFPIELIAGIVQDEDEEIDFGQEILNNVDEGSTINLWGTINYQCIIETKKKGGTLGKAKIEEIRTYINELVVEGGEVVEIEEKAFDEELIKTALIERENKIEEKRNEEIKDNDKTDKGKGLNKGTTRRERPKF